MGDLLGDFPGDPLGLFLDGSHMGYPEGSLGGTPRTKLEGHPGDPQGILWGSSWGHGGSTLDLLWADSDGGLV